MTSKSAPLGVRNVERPRPLGSVSHIGIPASNMANAGMTEDRRMSPQDVGSVEEVVQLLEQVTSSLGSRNYNKSVLSLIIRLSASLKAHGNHMEMFHRELLDKAQVALRNACKDTTLDIVARLHLLEIIELRAMKWVLSESVINYYKQKLSMCDHDDPNSSANNARRSLNVNAPLFMPNQGASGNGGNILDQLLPQQNVSSVIPSGEVMMSSGKYTGPTQPHGKSYFKDEVFIRNADSGKVMGVKGRRVHMIEEMSDTIISFQRVLPGSMDRLVQITGSVPTNVAQAKVLMEDTIRRNQSPLPDGDGDHSIKVTSGSRPTSVSGPTVGNTMTAAPVSHTSGGQAEYKFSVRVGDDVLKISSTNLQLVKSAKILLDEHYTCNVKTTMTAFRQPLFPDSSKEAVDMAEMIDGGGHSQQRRDNFAKTAQTSSQEDKKDVDRKICYDRQFLLKCAQAPSSGKFPPNWEQVVSENPDVIKKVRNNNTEFSENLMSWNANLGQWVSPATRS